MQIMNAVRFGNAQATTRPTPTNLAMFEHELWSQYGGYVHTSPRSGTTQILTNEKVDAKAIHDLVSAGRQVDSSTNPASILYEYQGELRKVQVLTLDEARAISMGASAAWA